MPPMIGGIRFEHSHRLIAGSVGIFTLILMGMLLRWEPRRWMKNLGIAAFLAVVLQAVLGGLTVIYLLPRWISVFHACLGQTFFATIVLITYFLSTHWSDEGERVESTHTVSFQRLALATTAFIYIQLILGALTRHGQKTDPIINYHYLTAFLVFLHAIFLIFNSSRDSGIKNRLFNHALLLGGLITLQIFLGFGAFLATRVFSHEAATLSDVFFRIAHQANGALVLMTSVLLTARCYRGLAKSPAGDDSMNYLELVKPRLTLVVAITTFLGYWMALPDHHVGWHKLFHVLLATLFIGAGANTFNQILEKDADAKMKRTQNRPLASGRMEQGRAIVFGATTAIFGIIYMFFLVNTLSGILGLVTFSIYVFCYTPMKRWSRLNTFVGAIPGAIPVVMGWAAARGSIGVEALALFMILYFWQLPHFIAILWTYKKDYLSGGFKMITLSDPEGVGSARQLVFYAMLTALATLWPFYLGMSGKIYFVLAVSLGVLLVGSGIFLAFKKLKNAKFFIPISIAYLLLLSLAMTINKQF